MQFGKHSENTTRIRVDNIHIGRIHNDTVSVFETILKSKNIRRDDWIQQQILKDFGFKLNKENLPDFDTLTHERHYEDRGDWLRDKIRHFLQENGDQSNVE
ncbi:MAG: hypothetical protein AB7G87_09120 [Clostridia bacterium]